MAVYGVGRRGWMWGVKSDALGESFGASLSYMRHFLAHQPSLTQRCYPINPGTSVAHMQHTGAAPSIDHLAQLPTLVLMSRHQG